MKSLLFCCHPKAPLLCFPQTHSNFLPILLKFTSTTARTATKVFSTSTSTSTSTYSSSSSRSSRPNNRNHNSPSLYSRPSLAEMQRERAVRRADVYAFLRSLGIDPGELDSLDLPATVDVMRERVEFLHSLGLTVDDINGYPLVLGCSVRKNMVPVLDFLGKLGLRQDALPAFLRRYPQVLHASVVVDLQPVVNYLQGMDVKPANVARVLERYPEVLGFKLEGTMSTSVAFLVGIGVGRREIGNVLTRYPEIVGMRVGKVIKPFVEHLESIGLPRLAVARLIETKPYILGFSLEDQVRPNIEALLEFGVGEETLASVVAQYPEILGIELKEKLHVQQNLFESSILIGRDDFGRVLERMPQAVSLGRAAVLKRVNFLKGCGFMLQQVSRMVVGCPQLLALNIDVMRMSVEYLKSEMDRELEELVEFPAFFTYGLESTVRPRNEMITKKGLKCSLAWMLSCSDAKFDERMKYDSFGIEEMEAEPSFDMKRLVEPTEENDAESEYDDDDDDDDSDIEDGDDEYFLDYLGTR